MTCMALVQLKVATMCNNNINNNNNNQTKPKKKRLDERACLQVDTGQQQSHEIYRGVWGLGIRV